jgi:hypothetical protein
VLQSFWEIQIPWNLALIGVPAGWTDENQWYWDVYLWKRRPWKPFTKLLGWVAGSSGQAGSVEDALDEEADDSHSYLFGRAGEPVPLQLWVASRTWIVGTCSGIVLLVGFFLMFSRKSFRAIWVATAALCVLGAAFAHPSALLLFLQSALSGVVLVLLGLLIQRVLERARSDGAAMSTPGSVLTQAGTTGSALALAGVGSDDSTAVRVRVSSTVDHEVSPLVLTPEQPSGPGSSIEQSE